MARRLPKGPARRDVMRKHPAMLLLLLFPTVLAWGSPDSRSGTPAPDTGSPVVVELFTSQGCSSCPPAEHVLSLLGRDESLSLSVVPLAFHVDYWNEGGWVDPFSQREWTTRQEAYRAAFGIEGSYTPQLVVNGKTQFNGGNGPLALKAIAAELGTRPPGVVRLTTRRSADSAIVDVAAEIEKEIPARKLTLLVALFENGVVTAIGGGENGGRTLENDFIVRRLATAFSLEPKAGARRERELTLTLDRRWKAEQVGVAAFLQDPASMRIYGAAAPQSLR
jgi:hypothetical protein